MSSSSNRLIFLDLLRPIFVLAIIFFHLVEASFYQDLIDVRLQKGLFVFVEALARTFSWSGFAIIFLAGFLFGFRSPEKPINYRPFIVIIFGFIILTGYQMVVWENWNFEWDVYHFLLVCFSALAICRHLKLNTNALAVIAIAALTVESALIWFEIPPDYDRGIMSVLFLNSSKLPCVGWTLFPWSGTVFLSFVVGRVSYEINLKGHLSWMRKSEFLMWIFMAGFAVSHYGTYYWTPVGPQFACFMSGQGLSTYFLHIFWLIFAVRLSFLQPIVKKVNQAKIFKSLQNFCWNRRFGASYVLHLPITALMAQFSEAYLESPNLFVGAMVVIFLAPHFGLRALTHCLTNKTIKKGVF